MKYKWLGIFVFTLLLWLPAAQMVTGFPRQPPIDENRKLAPAPILNTWKDTHQYIGMAVKWFDDHFGYRDFLIRSKTQIDYSVFGISTKVHVGSDGWLFYRSVMDIEKPQVELALRKNADEVVEGTRKLANALAARGVKLVIMVAPMKDVLYPKYLPSTAKQLPQPRQVDLLQARFRAMKEIIFIDSTVILQEAAKQRSVFHKTDFHWNDPGAFDVARSLVNEIGRTEGKAVPVWAHKLNIEERIFSGGEATFMPIFFPPEEHGLFVKPSWILPPHIYTEKKVPYEWIYEAQESTGNQLPPITVIGDSFFDGMSRSGIAVYFKKIYRTNWNSANLNELVSDLPSDTKYLFLEFIEVSSIAYKSLAAESQIK
ncbi:MAG: hypothetical protein ABIO88_07190 [Burkholderiaceae bacterium]